MVPKASPFGFFKGFARLSNFAKSHVRSHNRSLCVIKPELIVEQGVGARRTVDIKGTTPKSEPPG